MTGSRTCRESVLSLLLLVGAGAARAQLFPDGVISIPSLWSGSNVVSGDLNGDGHSDLVLSLQVSGMLRVMLSDGAGGIAVQADFASPSRELRLMGDLTGDGNADVVAVTTGTPSFVYVLPGDGFGGLGAAVAYPLGQKMAEAAIGDVDEDGFPDLVGMGLSPADGLLVLLGDGAGALSAPTLHPTLSPGSANVMKLADLDEDGHLDAVVANSSNCCNDVEVLLGDGAGTFASLGLVPLGTDKLRSLKLGDVNGDTHVDVVTTNDLKPNSALDPVGILLGDGHGGLAAPAYLTWPQSPSPSTLTLFDVESDGDLDLLLYEESADGTLAALNDGSGLFSPPGYLLPAGVVVLGSFDAESPVDATLVLNNFSSGGLTIVPGHAGGGFEALPHYSVGPSSEGLAVADLDGDGVLDVVRGSTVNNGSLSVQLGDGAGGLLPATLLPMVGAPAHVAVGDLDADGVADIVCSNLIGGNVGVFLGDGQGGFGAPNLYPSVINSQDLVLTDFDGDDDLDVITTGGTNGVPYVVLLRGDGSGALGAPISTHLGALLTELDVADIDHDGDQDLVGNRAAGVTVLRGDGNGGLQSVTQYGFTGLAFDVVFADLDLDGHSDIVATNMDGTIARLMGDGLGGFGVPKLQLLGSSQQSLSVRVADVSGDGLPDVVVSRDAQGRIFVALGDGAGNFSLDSPGYAIGTSPKPIAIADMNGDGRPDVLGAGSTYTSVMLNCAEPFAWKQLGCSLAGAVEAPVLSAQGTLSSFSSISLKLVNAAPLSVALLFLSATQDSVPFKGGVLVPLPDNVLFLNTDAAGRYSVASSLPGGVPSGFTFYSQVWVFDAGGPAGFTASNALSGTTP